MSEEKLPAIRLKSIREFGYNNTNPFMEGVIQKATFKEKKAILGVRAVDYIERDGEVKAGEFLLRAEEEVVDASTFRKIYMKSLDEFFDFSRTAQKVLKYFLYAMKRNSDVVDFDMEKCMKIAGLKSPVSIFKGIAELLNADVIARGNTTTRYFINPAVMFNGSRMAIIKKYRMEPPSKAVEG